MLPNTVGNPSTIDLSFHFFYHAHLLPITYASFSRCKIYMMSSVAPSSTDALIANNDVSGKLCILYNKHWIVY